MSARLPTKAVVLAAGFGTRLQPATGHIPKPMLPFWDVPMLRRTLHLLAQWGVRDVLINLHHLSHVIWRDFLEHPENKLRIHFSYEPDILGTAGALRKADWFIDRPFWLINSDVVADVNPTPLLRAFQPSRTLAACWLTETAGPRSVFCEKGTIRSFHDPIRGHATFCGLHLLHPDILRHIPSPPQFGSVISAYQLAQKSRTGRNQIRGVLEPRSFWADIGTPAQYVQAHRDWAKHRRLSPQATFHIPAQVALSPVERRALDKRGETQWLAPEATAEIFPPRGSQREFIRLKRGTHSRILVRWSSERAENKLYAPHTRLLSDIGIPVPQLDLDIPRHHILLMEDLGDATLQTRYPALSSAAVYATYATILCHLRIWHEKVPMAVRRSNLMPGFEMPLYRWEHDYFLEHVIQGHLRCSSGQVQTLRQELKNLITPLRQSPQSVIHRDLQSANILFRGEYPVFIDYQGMREGPIAYDLASLLADPYVDLPASMQTRLLRAYTRNHPQRAALIAAYPAAVLQRLVQAMGAFVVLHRKPGMSHYITYLPVAARQAQRMLAAQSAAWTSQFPTLTATLEFIATK